MKNSFKSLKNRWNNLHRKFLAMRSVLRAQNYLTLTINRRTEDSEYISVFHTEDLDMGKAADTLDQLDNALGELSLSDQIEEMLKRPESRN